MILNDETIIDMVAKGFLISENFEIKSLTPNGYDLRIDIIDVDGKQYSKADIPAMKHFLVSTMETLNMPEDVVGMIWTRSTFARKGIFGSFGAIDAGYHGNLTLSFFNADGPIELNKGDRIAQMLFVKMNERAKIPYYKRSGNYQHSQGIIKEPLKAKSD
ncbi:dCTP deaminase [Thermoplasma sp. Kam2015]|uniref:dCTP deaminase n=1 Tax=Thermoplasma sp. Kam2015 TaxID=2094122 RepID=UPI000D8A8FB9|nr:dCTP deaminase [Thermoplasma sp. Kam2015]PYB68596.1 dCTP deaminase [Thermoplasma sp. Kam2015]